MGKSKIEWTEELRNRFWSHVNKTDGCWEWQASLFPNGYGQFGIRINGKLKNLKAHRASYMILVGEIPEGKILCHTCDNRKCVNPNHLILGDNKFNTHDMDMKGRGNRNSPKDGAKGSKNHAAKLDEEKVKEIILRRKQGQSYKTLAENFNVSHTAIAQIIRGEKWQHVQR